MHVSRQQCNTNGRRDDYFNGSLQQESDNLRLDRLHQHREHLFHNLAERRQRQLYRHVEQRLELGVCVDQRQLAGRRAAARHLHLGGEQHHTHRRQQHHAHRKLHQQPDQLRLDGLHQHYQHLFHNLAERRQRQL